MAWCGKTDCAGHGFCADGGCLWLLPAIEKGCPFYKRAEDLEKDRYAAIQRLKRIHREDLMRKYKTGYMGRRKAKNEA